MVPPSPSTSGGKPPCGRRGPSGLLRHGIPAALFVSISLAGFVIRAPAATVDWGTLEPPDSGLFAQLHANPNAPHGSYAFSDDYTFDVSNLSSFDTAVLNFNLFPAVDIDELTVSLFEVAGATPLAVSDAGDGSLLDVVTLGFLGLTPSTDYVLNVAGTIPEWTVLGGYAGKFDVTLVTLVPLPPAAVLLVSALLGLLVINRTYRAPPAGTVPRTGLRPRSSASVDALVRIADHSSTRRDVST